MTPVAHALALVEELVAMRRLTSVEASALLAGLNTPKPQTSSVCLNAFRSNRGVPEYLANGLAEAVKAVGTARALAQGLGISEQAISQWEMVPPLRVLEVVRLTGVPAHVIRPDLHAPPSEPERV